MQIDKPSWLRTWLDRLNWDILGFQLYVGDAIEYGIDWLLGWVSQLITWGQELYVIVADFIEEVREAFEIMATELLEEVLSIWDTVNTWWDNLEEWWSARWEDVQELVDISVDWVLDLVDDIQGSLYWLESRWDDFWTAIWPQWLSSLEDLWSRVTEFFTDTLPTLASHLDISAAFDAFRLEWAGLFNFWEEFRDTLAGFFGDPVEWLFSKVIDWFLGPED